MFREQDALPLKLRFKISLPVNALFLAASSVENILKQSGDFQNLSTAARYRLLKNNIIQANGINAIMIDKIVDLSSRRDTDPSFDYLFGTGGLTKIVWIVEKMDANILLFKILLYVVLFSNNYSIIKFDPTDDLDTCSYNVELTRIQSKYATILWKYMVYQFGYLEAVRRYSSMIGTVLGLFHIFQYVGNMDSFTAIIDSVAIRIGQLMMS